MSGGWTIRRMRQSEYAMLPGLLLKAIYLPEGTPPPSFQVVFTPELLPYTVGFGAGAYDRALCAVVRGEVIGAVWMRLVKGFGYLDDATPELVLVVEESFRGRGIGTELLRRILLQAADGGRGAPGGRPSAALAGADCKVVSPRRGAGRIRSPRSGARLQGGRPGRQHGARERTARSAPTPDTPQETKRSSPPMDRSASFLDSGNDRKHRLPGSAPQQRGEFGDGAERRYIVERTLLGCNLLVAPRLLEGDMDRPAAQRQHG